MPIRCLRMSAIKLLHAENESAKKKSTKNDGNGPYLVFYFPGGGVGGFYFEPVVPTIKAEGCLQHINVLTENIELVHTKYNQNVIFQSY